MLKLHFCILVFTDSFPPFETFVLMPPIWFVFSMPIELGLNRIPVVKVTRDHPLKTSTLLGGGGVSPLPMLADLKGVGSQECRRQQFPGFFCQITTLNTYFLI